MITKLSGMCLLLLAGYLMSAQIRRQYALRIKELENFIRLLNILKTEIGFLRTSLKEIIDKLLLASDGVIHCFFKDVMREMENGVNIREAWVSGFNKNDASFSLCKKDKEILLSFSKTLGATDYSNQIDNINATIGLLELELEEAKSDCEKNQKSKSALVFCVFVVAGIIFL